MAYPVLSLRGIKRVYAQGDQKLHIFDGIDLDIQSGEIIALVGPSGAGKSSLLHIAGLLERPTAGEVFIAGRDCVKLSETDRTAVRRNELGFVYQSHNLLAEFSALENVVLPQMIAGVPRKEAGVVAQRLLEQMGLGARASHRPAELSGGEQQRVAIARALANSPGILLADEPTGNLDPRTSGHVFEELIGMCRSKGVATLIATHNFELAQSMDRIVRLDQGQLVEGLE
ncbi:MAG: ABC transporter ATP-binding protein [Parvibaculaceae bacterium]|nr:ABC transporter ATP-binding protein [Parvibaculaceae bacterium]